MFWIEYVLGLNDPGSAFYLAWSGVVGDLPELAVLGVIYHRLNCHARGCWRIGLHRVRNSHYLVCRHHHPDHEGSRPYTAQQIDEHSREGNGR